MAGYQKNNITGFFVNVLSMLMFVTVDILIKHLTQVIETYEIVFYRCASGLPFFLIYIYFTKQTSTLKMVNVKLQFLRMFLGVFGMLSFFTSYKYMPLAEASAILYTSPIILTIFSILFLKEKIKIHRTFALIMGIIGALLIIKPGSNFQFYSLFAIVGATIWACVILTMRALNKTDHANSITLYFSLAGTVLGGIAFLIFGITPITDLETIFLVVLLGIVGLIAQLLMTISVEMCDTSLFASSKYINLVFTSIGAYFVFNEVLSNQSMFGMALIILSGLYMVWREHVLNKAQKIRAIRY